MVDPEKEFFLSKAKISTDDSICYVLNNRILKKQRQSTPTWTMSGNVVVQRQQIFFSSLVIC